MNSPEAEDKCNTLEHAILSVSFEEALAIGAGPDHVIEALDRAILYIESNVKRMWEGKPNGHAKAGQDVNRGSA